MPDEKTDFPEPRENNGEFRQAKGCLLLIATTILVLFVLVMATVLCIIVADTISLRGEEFTWERRVERYKVACQFIWADFKDTLSRKKSNSSQEDEP